MKAHNKIARVILALCAALALVAPIGMPVAQASPTQGSTAASAASFSKAGGSDFLYMGDGNDTVKRFDATSGAYLGDFVTSGSQGCSVLAA